MKKMLNELVRYGKFAFALAFALCCFNASAATVERGGESFPSWVEFMSGVNEGDTVKLTADVTAGNTNAGQNMVKKSITIDLNGHSLYGGFGWWLDCLITVKDSSAGNGIFDLTTNCNGCSFDFTALSPSQIVPGHQLNPSTGKLGCVRFPDGMELADCQTKIKTLADGQHIVLEGQTYVWTSSGWVLEAALTPVADAAANRTAISNAIRDAGWAGTVELSEGIFEIDTRITLNNGVTLKGQGWGKTIIKQTATTAKADGGCFTIDKGARLEGVTVTGGKDSSSPGAGVWIKKGTVSWCCISNNLYQSGTAKAGAGVSFESGEGTIDHSIVVGNELDAYAWGAGIGARSQTGDILIDTCLVYGNVNDKGSAGGVAFDNTTKTGTIRNCTIVGNTANTNVGGVYSNNGNGGKLVLINNIITGNKQGSNEINLFVQNSHLDQEASSNCLVTGSSTGTAPWKDASVVSTLEGKGFTNVDPGFINAAANDYRLGLISAAKGAGADGSGSGVDLANKAFAATPSIGCYEYDSDAALQLGWTAAPMSASGDTICNVGDFVYGYAHKSGGVGTYTVNEVTFKTFNDGDDFQDSSKNSNVTISPDTFDWVFGLGNEGVSGDYGGMLDTAFGKKSVGGPFTFTLKNLQAGEKYLVQVVAHSHGQAYKVTSPDLTKVINVGGAGWTYGGSLIGVFTADTNGEYGFTLNYDPWIMVNAIQVRKLADTPPPSPPSAEWDTEHGTFAKRIAFTASGYEGSGTLENFPVLVRLTESITDFDYDDCDQSKIVFTDASGAILPHEVDTWHTSGESLVWVNVASLSQDATFYMYFDGEPEEVNDATKTWTDSDYAGVWHMNEASGAVVDATGHGLTATPAGNNASTESVAVSGAPTGTGRQTSTSIDKAGAYLKVASDDALNVGDDFTMSGWVKMTAVTGYPRLFGTKDAATDLGWEFEMHAGTFDSITIRGTGSGTDYKKKISSLQNTWRHVVAVFDGTTATLYVDGEVVSDGIGVTNLGTGSKGLGIGNKPAGGASDNFAGDFDECRLLDAVASADWVKAEYQQSAKPEFLVAGAVETHVASTYTVSWTGGVNATVVATVDSTPIDTGDSVEDGKSVVFTVTPNSGYEFATASDGWTKSGANLTKTVTVNGAAVAVVIPGATAIPVVATPGFSPAAGTITEATDVTITCATDGATIYYTTNGDDPTSSSTQYTAPIAVSATTTIKAIAVKSGYLDSSIASATYVKANADAGDYYVSTEGSDFADGLTPETAFRTIEHAVEVANEGQKVTILPGTFEIDETIVIDKAITVTGSGWDKTTIQPTSGTKIRLFILAGGAKLEGVTLTGGNVSSDNGAAAWVKNGTISWCRITNNKSNFGSTSGNGGAAVTFDEGQGTIDHCIVANNTGSTYCYGSVGAVKQSGPVVVDTCLIYQNNAYNGGGVGFSGGTSMGVTVKNCTIVGNTGTGGGGIYFANGGSVGTCKIINTIATGNTAGSNNFDLETSPNATASLLVEKCFFGSAPTANHKVTTSVAGTYTIGTADFTDDYHPAAGWEGVIGAGVSYEGIGETLDGMPFNDPPSIGCYEPSIGFGKVTFAYPAKHVGTATVQLIGLSDGATTANVTFQYGPDSEHLCEPAIVVTNGVVIKTDIVATMTDLNANCEYAYRFTALDDKGQTATRSGVFMTDDWDTLQFSTVKATPTSNSADVSVTIMKLGLGATNATVYVQWGTNYNDLCQAIRISTTASQKQTLTYTITGLKNETDYVVRFSGENDVGDTATRDGAFRTLEKEKLALGEPKVSNLGQTTADIAVTVPTLGENAKSATVTLKWWIDGTTDTNSVVMSSAAVRGSSLSQQLTGLMENTLYRYEIVAVNDLPAPDTETKSVTGGFTTDDPNIGADDYHDSYPTVDNDHVVTYDADSAGNPSTLEPGSPYVVVAKEGYGVSHPAGGKTYWFRNEYDYQYNCSARIGDTYYLFLTDAVTAAQANDKIELLRNNYAISETMQINKKLTIEGNGYAVKVAAPFLDNTGYVNPKCTATPKTVFKIGTGGDVVINDMLVMGGGEQLSTGGAGSNSANEPAIVVTDTGILEMDHVTVKRSQGGLWVDTSAKAHLNACNLVKNARFCGGGFYSKGVLVMENSSLSENRSLSSSGGGAAAENQGLLVMNNCVICNNGSTEYGGAINNLNGGIVYMMNMTMAGNFSSHSSDYGGGIGLHQSSGDLYMLNCILCNNYHYVTTSGSEHIDVSDIRSDSGNNHFLYSVYGVCTGGTTSEFKECFPVVAADQDVFKGYSPFARTYEQNKTTVATIPGPSFDTAPSNEDARYASLTENGSKADVDNEGVYTYFDASAWRSAASNKDVSWLEMAYREEGDTTLTALGKCATTADEEDLVTTYYETAFDPTISDRELGVVGASGFGTHKKTYTLYLLANPVNGGVSDNLNLNGKSYDQGVEVTVVATPAAKCTFLGWYDTKDTTAEPVSTKLAYSFVMDSDKSLLARFSEPSETHRFLKILCEQEAGTHDEFPIEITKTWLMSEFGDEPKTEEQFNVIEAALNEPDPANGLNHKWMNYVLGLKIGDPDGKIWIRGSQNSDSGKLTFSVQELSETKDCGFIVRYRLPKMNLTKDETSYNREGEYINTKKGTFEDAVSDDLQYRIIDMIFIPTNANTRTGKTLNTSFEYMTTVNTAGVMKVTSDKKVEILASPWVGFSPTNNPTIKATDYVKASCLNKDDILYIYDRAHSNYLAWAVQDGQWAQKDTYQIINGVVYKDDDPADIANTNSLPRGMGAWLERSNVKSPIYLYGQVDPSPVTTSLEPGFNLVGNPYPFEYDASQLGAPTGSASDQIVIPTGLAPIVSEYRADFNGGEGAWVHQGYTVTTQNVKGVAREVKKACLTTDGLTLPIGHGFWYNNLSDEQIELVWPKNVNVSEIK